MDTQGKRQARDEVEGESEDHWERRVISLIRLDENIYTRILRYEVSTTMTRSRKLGHILIYAPTSPFISTISCN
jgi:hypothetical protein